MIETGPGVEFIKQGDLVSAPFNISCGRCRNCKERNTGVCLNVNPAQPGGAYGYVDMGGWIGGQAESVMVPYADWNLLKFPDREQAMEKILDLTMLSDIFPTGYHGCVSAGVGTGATVYVAGAGPVGLAAAHSAQLLGAAVVVVGDSVPERLEQARSFGCETIDISADASIADQIEQILGVPGVDCAVDAVGFEAKGHGGEEQPAVVLSSLMEVTRAAGKLGIPGLYVGHEVPPRADERHPQRPLPDRQGGQRDRDHPRRRPAGLQGIRRRRGEEVRHRPARIGGEGCLGSVAPARRTPDKGGLPRQTCSRLEADCPKLDECSIRVAAPCVDTHYECCVRFVPMSPGTRRF